MYCNYFLFVEAPYVDGGARVYQVVYLCPDKNGSDRATFTCYADYHGVCGISPNKRLTARVSVNVTDSRPVKLGEEDKDHGTRLLMSGGLKPDGGGGRSAKFIESNDSESRGRFQIDCCDFVYNNGGKTSSHFPIVLLQRLLTIYSKSVCWAWSPGPQRS